MGHINPGDFHTKFNKHPLRDLKIKNLNINIKIGNKVKWID